MCDSVRQKSDASSTRGPHLAAPRLGLVATRLLVFKLYEQVKLCWSAFRWPADHQMSCVIDFALCAYLWHTYRNFSSASKRRHNFPIQEATNAGVRAVPHIEFLGGLLRLATTRALSHWVRMVSRQYHFRVEERIVKLMGLMLSMVYLEPKSLPESQGLGLDDGGRGQSRSFPGERGARESLGPRCFGA